MRVLQRAMSVWFFFCGVRLRSVTGQTQTQSALDIVKSTTVMLFVKRMVNKVCIGAKSTFLCFAKHDLVVCAGLCFLLRSLFVLVLLP